MSRQDDVKEALEKYDGWDGWTPINKELAVIVAAARTSDKANMRLLSIVEKATPYGEQDGGFIAYYIIPTGPIHRAILHLQQNGYDVPTPASRSTPT